MKKSNYNFFKKWQNFYIGCNLLSGQKVVLLKNEYELYKKDIYNLLETEMFSKLIDAGFIVEDSMDEFSRIIYRRNNDVFYNKHTYRMIVLPTLECNFKCWYCYEKHPKSVMSVEVLNKLKLYFTNIITDSPLQRFHLDWFGGEPLLYFDEIIYVLSKFIKEKLSSVKIVFLNTITTNGYLITDDMCHKMKEINLNQFQITLDGYKDTHNKIRYENKSNGSYYAIIDNINRVCNIIPDAHITLRINYQNSTLAGINNIVDDIHVDNRPKVTIVFQRVWQTKDKEVYDEYTLAAEIDKIQHKGIFVSKNNFDYKKGCLCYADSVYQSVVNFDGAIYKCTARDFVNKDYSVGHLNSQGYPVWNEKYYKYFSSSPLLNKKCKKCRYAPVCLGVCAQKFVEEGDLFVNNHCDKKSIYKGLSTELLEDLYNYLTEKCTGDKIDATR